MNLSELRQYILLIAGRLVKWSTVDKLTGAFGGVFATMPAATDSPGQSTTQPARNMIGFGFRSAPVAGSECIVVAPRGGAVNAAVVATDHLGYGPTDLAEGEVAIYGKAHHEGALCVIRLDADGNVTIIPKTGAKVRLGDSVAANLDQVALFQRLKDYIDKHTHLPGTLSNGAGAVVGVSGQPVMPLPPNVGSPNVSAKK